MMSRMQCWHLGRPGLTLYTSHQQTTHCVGPFGNNLRAGCSLTRNSNGVPQNQVSACKEGDYCTTALLNNYYSTSYLLIIHSHTDSDYKRQTKLCITHYREFTAKLNISRDLILSEVIS